MIYKEELLDHISDNKSCESLKKIFNCSKTTIVNYLKKYEIHIPKGFYKRSDKKSGRPKGTPCSEQQKNLMSKKFTGENNPFFGRRHNSDTRKKMSINHANVSGDNNPFKKSIADQSKLLQHKIRCKNIWENRDKKYRKLFGDKLKRTAYEEISGQFWARLKANAKTRNINVEVDIKYCWNLFLEQNRTCALSGIKLTFSNQSKIQTASLDRINSSLGYVKENLQWVHKTINLMKRNLTTDEFVEFCKKVVENNGIK